MIISNHILVYLFSIILISTNFITAQNLCGPYTADDNTILLMHFDGNLTNTSSASSDGTSNGSGISYNANTLAHLGQCLSLDNSNSTNKGYISVPHNNNLNLSESWTIEAWVYFNSIGDGVSTNPTIVSKAVSDDFNYFLWYHDSWGSAKGQFTNTSNNAIYTAVGNNTITAGQWYHIAYIRDHDQHLQKLIIRNANEEVIGQNEYQYGPAASVTKLNAQDLLIGSLQNTDGFFFDGFIDELRISNVVRTYIPTLSKLELTSSNFRIYYDQENASPAGKILNQLQNKIDYYKRYFKWHFTDHSKVFTLNICKDVAEFNQNKPAGLPIFETAYLHNEIIYLLAPTTSEQKAYFTDLEQAAMHAFAMTFIDYGYSNNAAEWIKYGFARHESGMKSTPAQIKSEVTSLGRKPTYAEMFDWDNISTFDKYAFAYTMVQYLSDVHSFNWIFGLIRFQNNSTVFGFRQFNTEAKFNESWHYDLDVFYLREQNRIAFQRETDHYYLYLADEDLSELDQWASGLETFYTRFTNDMQMILDQKIHVFFYPSLEDYHYIQGNESINPGSVGEAMSIDLAKFTRSYAGNDMMFSLGLAQHEITHVIHMNLDFNRNPRWVLEGLATLMPSGLMTQDDINEIREQINVGFSEVAAAAGRYPTIDDMDSDEFIQQNGLTDGLMFYLLGSVFVDYIIKETSYLALKDFIEAEGTDYTILGFTDKYDFANSFYTFYEQTWKIPPHQASANRIYSQISIDGNITETDWQLNQNVTGVYPFYQDWSNNTVKYGALWDTEYLYVAVEVLDHNPTNNSSDGWNDEVSIYVDADFNKSFNYDAFDRKFIKGWNNPSLTEKNNLISGVLHSVKNISGGYVVEMAIPWSNLGITPTANSKIGFDVSNQVRDGNSKYELMWSGNNLNYGTTINFGELLLYASNAPIISTIANQNINEGQSFSPINLDNFVIDPNDNISTLKWTYTGNTDLSVVIDANRIATITPPSQTWSGSETITFRATDPLGEFDSESVTFTVGNLNDPPVISSIPNQTIAEGSYFSPINLADFVTDGDNELSEITFGYSGNSELSVFITNGIVSILTPDANWFGSETITFTATDPHNAVDTKNVTFTVTGVNDPPVITEAPEYIEFVSDSFYTINIWDFISDIETQTADLICDFIISPDSILSSYNESSGILTITAELLFGGSGSLTWRISDGDDVTETNTNITVRKAVIVDVNDTNIIPEEFALKQNYPNPFNPSTTIQFALPYESNVKIEIFNNLGKLVELLQNRTESAGTKTILWSAANQPSGVYYIRADIKTIESGKNYNFVRKMLLLK